MRLGLVGCGRLAELGYVPAAMRATGVELVAVADPDPIRRQHVAATAARAGVIVSTHASAGALVEHAALDAVVVASPVSAHEADAVVVTNAGVAVLVEKPLAPDAARAAHVASLSPTPWVGFNRRFDPGAQRVRAAAAAHRDDRLDVRAAISYRRRSWRAHTVNDDALLDLGPHLVDWSRWVMGDEALRASALEVTPHRAVFDVQFARGRARLTAATDQLHHEVIEVIDARGRRIARHHIGGPAGAVRGRFARGDHPLVTTLSAQLEHYARAVRLQPSADLATAVDGVAVMAVLDAVGASAVSGGATQPVRRLWET
ncbi:MAG: Gfo/Idh/MocA family oxidoreductase [Acidimicrobiia bacterium]